jgi:hypothetical protein
MFQKTLFAVSMLLVSCMIDDIGVVEMPINSNSVQFVPGEKRVYFRQLINTYPVSNRPQDEYNSVGLFEIGRDTIIDGKIGKVVSIQTAEKISESDSVWTYEYQEFIVNDGKKVDVYQFKGQPSGFLFTLMKRSVYDSSIFSDRMTILDYPLTIGKKWGLRDSSDPNDNWRLEKEFIGKDTVNFDGREYECAKLALHSIVDLNTCVSAIGLLYGHVDYGLSVSIDTSGAVLDSINTIETFKLVSINPTNTQYNEILIKYGLK